jgi:FMN phosphatase YigB (HAD superfamily)
MSVSGYKKINYRGKKVAFDIGNVLFHFSMDNFIDFLADGIIESKERATDFMMSTQSFQDLGVYDIKQGFARLKPNLKDSTLQKIHDLWLETFTPSEEMMGVVQELYDSGYEIALLSNVGSDHANLIRDCKYKVINKCIHHFSCEVGAKKPSRLFFQSFVMRYNWDSHVKYFDDRHENILSANEYYNSILFNIEDFESDAEAAKSMREQFIGE